MARLSKGRQRVEMEKMKKKSSLQVTFSKRRHSLFRKASQLSSLCDAQLAILVYTPSGKPLSYGHPNFDRVARQSLGETVDRNGVAMEIQKNTTIRQLNTLLAKVTNELEWEKKIRNILKRIHKEREIDNRLESDVDTLNLEELGPLDAALKKLLFQLYNRKDLFESHNLMCCQI